MTKAKGKKINTTLNMARWIQALRSGRYKQGHGSLKNGVAYCCLGVACVVSKVGRWTGGVFGTEYTVSAEDSSEGSLPVAVKDWLGVPSTNPPIAEELNAIHANDTAGMTFKQIADALELRYLGGKSAKTIVARANARAKKAADRRADERTR